MAEAVPQTFNNHTRIIPVYLAALGIFLANIVYALNRFVRFPTVDTTLALLLAVAFMVLALFARRFTLTVQDRVIRLEMQLRLRGLLPPDLQGRIPDLTRTQLIALRFAGDDELPGLCRTVLADNITEGKTIKKMIRNWTADHLRA